MHVHVFSPDDEVKFWLEPQIELAKSAGLTGVELAELLRIIEERDDEIREHWQRHFRRGDIERIASWILGDGS